MLHHLGTTVRQLRRDAKVKLVMIGAALNRSEAALSRFEGGKSWPQDVDATVDAYAAELGVEPLDIWLQAIRAWGEEAPGEIDLSGAEEAAGPAEDEPDSGAGRAAGQSP